MIKFSAILSVEAAIAAVDSEGYALQYVPEALMSEAVVFKAVESEGEALRYVPKAFMSEAVLLKAVERDGYALKYVPEELMSESVVSKAVESDSHALQYILKKSLFISIATKFGISIDIKEPNAKAIRAYDAYCAQAGGLTFDGKPLPTFDELGEERKACWIAAVDAI